MKYEKLEVYNLALDLTMDCYRITDEYPKKEIYSLAQQSNRAAVSIASNIAEGVGRYSDKDTKHFINLAYSSLMELLCQMDIAYRLDYLNEETHRDLKKDGDKLAIKLSNFVKYLDKKI